MNLKEGFIQYQKVLIVGFILVIITAFFSSGYHNPDEHWQINEFAAFKLGYAKAENLPWEFNKQARQTIQPAIVYLLGVSMRYLGIYDPFQLAFILRLISAILAFLATNLIILQARTLFNSERIFFYCLCLANFLWFVPYIHVRFQGENWSGIFLAFGVYFALKAIDNHSKNWFSFLAGISLGLGFDMRFQIAFSIIALGIWLLVNRKLTITTFFALLSGFGLMLGLEVMIDYWFYGEFIFMPYRYFHIQLLEHVSDGWGVFPWWYYGELFLMHVAPPISIVLLAMLLISTFLNYKNLYIWLILSFVIGHNINGYKEIRYLYPLFPFFCLSIFLMFNTNYWEIKLEKIMLNKLFKLVLIILLVQNFAMLTISSLKPSNEMIGLLEKIYSDAKTKPVKVFYLQSDPYDWGGLRYDFYSHPNISLFPYDSAAFQAALAKNDYKIILASQTFNLDEKYQKLPLRNYYKTVPDWLKYVNFNNWLERARVWSLYETKKD